MNVSAVADAPKKHMHFMDGHVATIGRAGPCHDASELESILHKLLWQKLSDQTCWIMNIQLLRLQALAPV